MTGLIQEGDVENPAGNAAANPTWAEYRDTAGRVGRPKGPSASVNKTRLIREEARKLVAKGKLPRPRWIIDTLKKDDIHVSSAQVTMACKGVGLSLREHRRKQKEERQGNLPTPKIAIGQVSIDDLIEAREFVRRLGSVDRAIASLIAFRQFGDDAISSPKPAEKVAEQPASSGRKK